MADLTISWKRRTRIGGEMRDLSDVPLSEISEGYEVDILGNAGAVVRTLTATSQSVVYTDAQQNTDFGASQTFVDANIYQMGKWGRGFPYKYRVGDTIPGLVWKSEPASLDSDYSDGEAVTFLPDLSGRATAHMGSSATASERPTFKKNIQNGLSVIRFVRANNQRLFTPYSPITGAEPRTIFMVYRATTYTGGNDPVVNLNYTPGTGAGAVYVMTADPILRISGGNRTWAAGVVSTWYVVGMRAPKDGTTNDVVAWRNATSAMGVTGTTVLAYNTGSGGLAFGHRLDTAAAFDGDLGDVWAWRREFTDAEMLKVMTSLRRKWNI